MFASFVVGCSIKDILVPLYISLVFVGLIWSLVFFFAIKHALEYGFKDLERYFHNKFDEMFAPVIAGPIYAYGYYFIGFAASLALEWLIV